MSKGLEDLKWLVENEFIKSHGWPDDAAMFECVDNIEKALKVLEIIKEKGVNVGYFIHRLKENSLSYKEYASEQKAPYLDIYVSSELLTKKEFFLLKEVLL